MANEIENVGTRIDRELGETSLTVKATIHENGLFFRESIATATLKDGREIEIAMNIGGGSLLVTISEDGKWKTYVIAPSEFVEAVLREES